MSDAASRDTRTDILNHIAVKNPQRARHSSWLGYSPNRNSESHCRNPNN